MQPGKKYASSIFTYSTPQSVAAVLAQDQQAQQAAVTHLLQTARASIEARHSATTGQDTVTVKTARWHIKIRSMRLQVGGNSRSPRYMYTVHEAATASQTVTVVIEDPAHSAVNISILPAAAFEHFLMNSLLPPVGSRKESMVLKAGEEKGAQDPASASSQALLRRWTPRPSYVQLEGAVIHDTAADVRLSIGLVTSRGGASVASTSASGFVIVQVEFLGFQAGLLVNQTMLAEEYLHNVLQHHFEHVKNMSTSISNSDWRSLLSLEPSETELPEWSPRNVGWCLVKLCKEAKLL